MNLKINKVYSWDKLPKILLGRFFKNNEFSPFSVIEEFNQEAGEASRKFNRRLLAHIGLLIIVAVWLFSFQNSHPKAQIGALCLVIFLTIAFTISIVDKRKEIDEKLEKKWGANLRTSLDFLDALEAFTAIHNKLDLSEKTLGDLMKISHDDLKHIVVGTYLSFRHSDKTDTSYYTRLIADAKKLFQVRFNCYLKLHLVEGDWDKAWERLEQPYLHMQ